jgi:hypothetical protein
MLNFTRFIIVGKDTVSKPVIKFKEWSLDPIYERRRGKLLQGSAHWKVAVVMPFIPNSIAKNKLQLNSTMMRSLHNKVKVLKLKNTHSTIGTPRVNTHFSGALFGATHKVGTPLTNLGS